MVRPRSLMFVFLLLATAPLLLVTGCGSSAEQKLLQQYFQASRLRDNTTIANIATVSFSPTEQGTVQSFDITNVGPEERRPLKLRELAAAEASARKADEEFNKQKKVYQDANREAIERVLESERTKGRLKGNDAQVATAWSKWRSDTQEHAKKLTDARQALAAERSLAEISVYDARSPVDATKFDGELVTKDVTLKAKVRTPEGQIQDKMLHMRLTKADLKNGPNGATKEGRWIVTHVSEGDAAAGKAPTSN